MSKRSGDPKEKKEPTKRRSTRTRAPVGDWWVTTLGGGPPISQDITMELPALTDILPPISVVGDIDINPYEPFSNIVSSTSTTTTTSTTGVSLITTITDALGLTSATTEGETLEEEEKRLVSIDIPIGYRKASCLLERAEKSKRWEDNKISSVTLEEEVVTLDDTSLIGNVIAYLMNMCLDISNMKHTYNGKLHSVMRVPESYFTDYAKGRPNFKTNQEFRPSDNKNIMLTIASDFEIATIGNTIFGGLSLAVNSMDRHDVLRNTISFSIYAARCLLTTGALGGYSRQVIIARFKRFNFYPVVYRATETVMGGDAVRRYKTYKTGPFPIELLMSPEVTSESDVITQNQLDLIDMIELQVKLILDLIPEGEYSGGDDMTPDKIDYLKEEELFYSDNLFTDNTRRFMVVQRRMEQSKFRFFPQAMEPFRAPVAPIKFSTYVVPLDPEDGYSYPPIELPGDREPEIGVENTMTVQQQVQQTPSEDKNPVLGCVLSKNDRLELAISRLSHIWSPPHSDDNNCFFKCLLVGLDKLKGAQPLVTELSSLEEPMFTNLRIKYGINHESHLNMNEIQIFSDHFNIQFHFWQIVTVNPDDMDKIDTFSVTKARITQAFKETHILSPTLSMKDQHLRLDMVIHKSHCYLLCSDNPSYVTSKVKCSLCAQWINMKTFYSTHSKFCHYCLDCRRSYSTKNVKVHTCKGKSDFLILRSSGSLTSSPAREDNGDTVTETRRESLKPVVKSKKLTHSKKIWLADMEAFQDFEENDAYTVYAIGLMCLSDKEAKQPKIFYGKNALNEYLDYLNDRVSGTLWYYNGSSFDGYLHLKGMLEYGHNIDTNSFVKHGSRIMQFKQHNRLKVKDLCLFIKASLEDACKDWGVPQDVSKQSFDHAKVFDYTSALEHKEEVIEYLKYDVLSLAYLYDIYSKTMFDCFSMDINRAITPSQYAIQCWSTMVDAKTLEDIYIPHTGKEEDDDRAAYYGGRVMCVRKEYISTEYDEENPDKVYNYDDIEDYLIYPDINSLYPKAQVLEPFAIGMWKYMKVRDDQNIMICSHLNLLKNEEWMKRCMFKVDVTCPKDLIIAFLLERDSKGMLVHNLHNKVAQWYWGIELIEAVTLGYRITKIHEIKEWPKRVRLFDKYVNLCWQGRKDNPAPSQKNLSFKAALNILTGKFAQKSNHTSSAVFNTTYKPTKKNEFDIMMSKVVDFTPIFSEDGSKCAMMLELDNENKDPTYPPYISAQILANARVYVSRIMRCCNAYLNPLNSIYYTDTDSLVMPVRNLKALIKGGYIGKELGQLKCDLGPFRNNQFSKILKARWAAVKGPYSIVYLNPGESKLKEKIRVKGIRHRDKPFSHSKDLHVDLPRKDKQKMIEILNWIKDPFHYSLPQDLVKKLYYVYITRGSADFLKHLNWDFIKKIMESEGELICFYGGMRRSYFDETLGRVLTVRPTVTRRMVCKTDWWSLGKRVFFPESNKDPQAISYPPGFSETDRRLSINYEYESLLRVAQLL